MIVLASKSASRRAMLEAAGVAFEVRAADVDERAVERTLGEVEPAEIARGLAEAKALAVVAPGRIVLGGDSLAIVDGERFDKPGTRAEAARHLQCFSGKIMHLHSAAAIARDGAIAWSDCAVARLQFRELSSAFVDTYLDGEWPAVAGCVGVFRIEGPGVQLFERIEGDHFTVLGMPLLAVLAALRDQGELPK